MIFPAADRTGAVTLYLFQESSTDGDACKAGAGAAMLVSVPAAEVVTELMVPAGCVNAVTARAAVYGRRHHPERVFEQRPLDRLQQDVSLMHFGAHEVPPPITGAPGHC